MAIPRTIGKYKSRSWSSNVRSPSDHATMPQLLAIQANNYMSANGFVEYCAEEVDSRIIQLSQKRSSTIDADTKKENKNAPAFGEYYLPLVEELIAIACEAGFSDAQLERLFIENYIPDIIREDPETARDRLLELCDKAKKYNQEKKIEEQGASEHLPIINLNINLENNMQDIFGEEQATPVKAVKILAQYNGFFGAAFNVNCRDYEHYKRLPDVLEYQGKHYAKSGWNSDLEECCYQHNPADIAYIPGKQGKAI